MKVAMMQPAFLRHFESAFAGYVGTRILVALSGGSDSVALLHLLRDPELGLELHAAHVHHGVRGSEADEDAEFCRRLCEKLGVPFHLKRLSPPGSPREGREAAARAVRETRGVFLVSRGRICDARFSKACGGRTEIFSTAWEDRDEPCLASVRCWDGEDRGPLEREAEARLWILGRPPAFCADPPEEVRRAVLPDFDLATRDFYRWRVEYERKELEELLEEKAGIRVGRLLDLVPMERGPSGRIRLLRITGTGGSVTVGKELEIRRVLSPTHLYSSAFVARGEPAGPNPPERFILEGAGWGHGVGLCQIGAAVMAWKGRSRQEILARYFPGARLERLYD